MMRNAIIASSALMAARAVATGTAHVVNACKYEVHMCNTPAQGGGYEQIDKVLNPGDSYSQEWTQLGNGMGWSIKLAKTADYQTDLMQYEYTYHSDGIIWYDLSEVDGNPWDKNWMITASGQCSPKQQAYRYSTDDAYGMQACPASSEITVTLCSGESQEDDAASSASQALSSKIAESTSSAREQPSSYAQASTTVASTAPASTSAASTSAASTSAASVSSPSATDAYHGWGHTWGVNNKGAFQAAKGDASPSPTTLVTKKVSTANNGGYDVTVTDVETVVQTAYVTAGSEKKRHEHHPRHPHHKRAE